MSDENKTRINIPDSIITELLGNPENKEKIKAALSDVICKTFVECFDYGDLRSAIRDKVKETFLPVIKNYDMSEYMPVIETVLGEIAKQQCCAESKAIISNFKELTSPGNIGERFGLDIKPHTSISMYDLFKAYCKFLEKYEDYDRDLLEVDTDDRPTYDPVYAEFGVKDVSGRYSSSVRYNLDFQIQDDDENKHNAAVSLSVHGWKEDGKDPEKFYIDVEFDQNLEHLGNLNDFQIFLLQLKNQWITLNYVKEDYTTDEVYLKIEPEPDVTWN